ncbi:MAG: DegQ family serine endoprotease [Desulfovibrio sp.]
MIKKHTSATIALLCILALPAMSFAAALPQFTTLAETAGKAVVNINTVKKAPANNQQQMKRFFQQNQNEQFRNFFEQFERFMGPNSQRKARPQKSLGSGFVISPDGYIVTNNHVIDNAEEISVNFQGEKKPYEATLVGRDPDTDIALLKIKADTELPYLKFANSDAAKVGEWVLAIGNPFGLGHTITAGIISAKGRNIHSGPFDNFIQTDASINPGNSGGPLVNMAGEVVGINTAIIATGQGLGFAIPSTMADKIVDQLKNDKEVKRGWLGVTIQDMDENTAKALGMGDKKGTLIASVTKGEPADKAGVKAGDVVLAVNGVITESPDKLLKRVAGLAPGEKAKLTVWRRGSEKTISVTLGQRPTKNQRRQQAQPEQPVQEESLGIIARPVTHQQEAQALGLKAPMGLVITDVMQGGPASESGLLRGDVILEINQQATNTLDEMRSLLAESTKSGLAMLLVSRQGQNLFVTVPVTK